MKNILIITGLDTSFKMGGLENWYLKFSSKLEKDSKLYLFYNKSLPEKEIYDVFIKNNIIPIVFSYDKNFNQVINFIKFIKKNEIFAVHAQFENTLFFLPFAKLFGKKTFWHIFMANYYSHNNEWKDNFKSRLGVLYYRLQVFIKQFFINKVYCASFGVLKEHHNFFFFTKNRAEVNYLGMEKTLLEHNKNLYKNNHKKNASLIVSCIGFHAHVKGMDILLKAINELNKRGYKNVNYYQIGGSPLNTPSKETEDLHKMSEEFNLTNLTWIGVSNEIYKYLLESDIYVQPSRYEALSFTIMEAMSVGLPIIGSNACGIPEVVIDGENGYLFQPENHIDLANKIEILINDKELRNLMGEKSIEFINHKNFYSDTGITRIFENYK